MVLVLLRFSADYFRRLLGTHFASLVGPQECVGKYPDRICPNCVEFQPYELFSFSFFSYSGPRQQP